MLLVSYTQVLCHRKMLHVVGNDFKLMFWLFVVTSQGQMEALCNYLALPSNLFQLFQEHREPVTPLLQR